MKINIKSKTLSLFAVAMLGTPMVVSCVDEPDASNLYTALDLTIEQTLENDEDLSAFNAILKKTIYANTLSTWGKYSCFAPVNEGVSLYLDSLYNDKSCDGIVKPLHNGIKEVPNFESLDVMEKVELMPKELCVDLAKYHLSGDECSMADVSGQTTWNTMLLGRYVNVHIENGKTWLGPDSYIIEGDVSCSNGLIQKLSGMIRREDRLIAEQLATDENFSIFSEALKATGIDMELTVEKKDTTFSLAESKPTDRDGNALYCPTECKVAFTIFAESDDVFAQAGITDFQSLVEKCKEWYGGSAAWYNYLNEKNIQVSTGDDYTNEWNVLHMFVAYHILRAGMPVDQIVYEKTNSNQSVWNVSFGYEPQEYFETMLPNTLLKVWATNPNSQGKEPKLWINRYRQNNTLTDEYGTLGSDATHPIIFPGVQIDRTYNKGTLNGYIHKINGILKYDQQTVASFYERIRLDSSTFLYELINNGIRNATASQVSNMNGGGDGNRVAFDVNYFDNIVCYNPNTVLRFNVLGAWRAHNSDQFQGWDTYDIAFKLPHVPTGEYELRIIYPPMIRGGMMQFYLGESSDQAEMVAQGTPFDAQLNPYENASFGFIDVDPDNEEFGIESDQVMHVRGYMRAPASFSRATYNTNTNKLTVTADDPYAACRQMTGGTSCRTESGYGTMMLRRVVCTQQFKQGTDYWLRIKNLITNAANLGWSFDFVELVPTGIVNSQTMMEDWY